MKSCLSIRDSYRNCNPQPLWKRARLLKGKEIKSVKVILQMDEITAKDLLAEVGDDFRTPERAKKIRAHYRGVDKTGTLYWETNSGTTPGLKHYQRIQLLELKDAIELQKKDRTMTNRDVVNLAVFGDIKVWCSDASFTYYGWKYITWQLDAGLEPETRFPRRRNPRLKQSICKHLYVVLKSLPFHISEITRDLIAQGVLEPLPGYRRPKKYFDPEPEDKSTWAASNLTK